MPFVRPNRSPITSLCIAALLFAGLSADAATRGKPEVTGDTTETLEIQGGLLPVTRILGLDYSRLDSASAIERIFNSILESERAVGTNLRRSDLISYFRQYSELLGYLRRNGLIPPAGLPTVQEMDFPISGRMTEIAGTRKLLSFFGIKSRIRVDATANSGTVLVEESVSPRSHEMLYTALGLMPQEPEIKELRIPLQTERVSFGFRTDKWEKILSRKSQGSLFWRFIDDVKAMRLYLALSACSPKVREMLLDSVEPGLLLKSSVALSIFGGDIKVENGSLIFPGARQAWTGVPGSPPLSLNILFSNHGAPLLLYSVLNAAPAPIREFLTASPERLREYFEVVTPYASPDLAATTAATVSQELLRIFRMTAMTPEGLTLSLNGAIARPLLTQIVPGEIGEALSGSVSVTPRMLAKLLPTPGVSLYSEESRANTLEFFLYLQQMRPGLLSTQSIESLTKVHGQAPVFLDLIDDLEPDPELLAKYVEYCTRISAAGREGWNVSRTRTSQSIFFLLSAFRRSGAISREKASNLLMDALQAFSPEDEGQFALNVAGFLSATLMPELSRNAPSSSDPILAGLAGFQKPTRIAHRDRELVLDFSAERSRRIQETLATQSYTPIPVLLNLYGLLRTLLTEKSSGIADADWRALSERLNNIKTAEWTPGDSQDMRAIPRIPIDTVKRSIAAAGSWTESPATTPASRAQQIAAQLHTELGITLLSYCYAYSGYPEINILAFDPNLVRRHQFYPSNPIQPPTWTRSHFVQDEKGEGWMKGSLAGMGFEMTRLHIAQSPQDFGVSQNIDTAPVILFGLRQTPPALRTNRSQEYVAVATGLGRRLLSLAGTNDALGGWLRETLRPIFSQRRLDAVLTDEKTDRSAPDVVSRSELFLLGQAYFNSGDWQKDKDKCPDQAVCSALNRLDAIVPKPGSVDYNAFEEEVSRYGVLLSSRTGLSRFSFDMIDSYERLEKSLRPRYLYDRICDLRIRIAELNNALGFPAALEEIEGDPALPLILPPSSEAAAAGWKETIRRINNLDGQAVLGWVDELASRGLLITELNNSKAPKK